MKRILTIGEDLGRAVEKILIGPAERLTVASGYQALALHRERHSNVIAFGLGIPDMPPETFVRLIREDGRMKTVSLLLVCDDTAEDALCAARCGANAVIRPMSDQAALGDALRRLLRVPPRTDLRTLMRVSVPDPVRQPPHFFARSRNISTAGVLFEARPGLAPGDEVACSFPLPTGPDVSASGEIVRVVEEESDVPSLYGIAWRRLSPTAWTSIDGFVAQARAESWTRAGS